MQWKIQSPTVPKNADELTAVLFENRGLVKERGRTLFRSPPSPLSLTLKDVGIDPKEMKKAISLIEQAKRENWNVVVFGDYDCDGICGTSVLWETLYEMGIKAMPFIPDRKRHGYGLSPVALDEVLEGSQKTPKRSDLLISVDNGIVALEGFARLKAAGVHTILTDHHQPERKKGGRTSSPIFPVADVIIHTTHLCGTTVGWMLARELNPKKAESMLDLCAIATIADQVPLLGANRSFAKFGIEALRKTTRPGLLMLIEVAQLQKELIDTYAINYAIAPRINAMGRIGDPKDGLRMLCSKKIETARMYASKVQNTNIERQTLTTSMIEFARKHQESWQDDHIIIVESTEFHEGVIGLVAGKLVEDFAKPAIVISRREKIAKGSARSLAGIHITELLRKVRDELIDVGGHPMAAGFSLLNENIAIFTEKLRKLAKETIGKELLVKTLPVECEIDVKLVRAETVKSLEIFEPFGSANPTPFFAVRGLKLLDAQVMGKEKQHLKVVVRGSDDMQFPILFFGKAGMMRDLRIGQTMDIVGMLQINVWNGRTEIQMIGKDIE
ncbi:MAG: single-stranded-DNA-specific exonuclease RecJ [Candidatus Pacebacteria bacterium]|nr:single-stranded-DNA-specific exonuclease RecJ [Candidatus Paceibacterota bacterium]